MFTKSAGTRSALAIPPQQLRGQVAERRLVAAILAELDARPWEQTTVPRIARRAGVAVGGLYRRFHSKERLLLHAAHIATQDHIRPALVRTAREQHWDALSAGALIRRYLAFVARTFTKHRSLVRAVSQVSRTTTEPALTAMVRQANRQSHDLLRSRLRACRAAGGLRATDVEIDLAILSASAALREVILFNEPVSNLATGRRRQLVTALARAMCLALCVGDPQ